MLPSWYPLYVQKIESSLETYLNGYFKEMGTPMIEECKEMLLYATKGGKRLRAILALEFYLVFSHKTISDITETDDIWKLCIAIEILHAFSLVHDDMPCMDNDELRRGQLTVWKKYGEYQGLLAGDMLNTLCFEILSDISDAQKSKTIIKYISRAVGIYGMGGGQAEDMYYEHHNKDLTLDILIGLHNKKTGKLIQAAILCGIILAVGQDEINQKYADFGLDLGLAFQIQDDILDIEGTPEETGKSVGGEVKGFVYLLGLESSKKELNTLLEKCHNTIASLNSEKLGFIVEYVGKRNK